MRDNPKTINRSGVYIYIHTSVSIKTTINKTTLNASNVCIPTADAQRDFLSNSRVIDARVHPSVIELYVIDGQIEFSERCVHDKSMTNLVTIQDLPVSIHVTRLDTSDVTVAPDNRRVVRGTGESNRAPNHCTFVDGFHVHCSWWQFIRIEWNVCDWLPLVYSSNWRS